MNLIKIVIFTANPVNTANLRLEQEIREIKTEIERSEFRDQLEVISKGAVRVDDLHRTLQQHKPTIVHFSGHGAGEHGLVLEDNSGQMKLVPNDALVELFRRYRNTIKCVFLNACYSETQAIAIHQQIDCIVGMSRPIGDKTAIHFAPKFYGALAQGCSFQDAFDSAKNFLQLDSNSEAATPILKIRQGAANLLLQTIVKSELIIPQPIQPPFAPKSIGNISILGNGNVSNVVQGDDNTISQNINQLTTSSDLKSALDALAELKQAIANTNALGSYERSNAEGTVEFIEKEVKKPRPDKPGVKRAITALKQALEGIVTLAEPVTKVAELLAKAWMI